MCALHKAATRSIFSLLPFLLALAFVTTSAFAQDSMKEIKDSLISMDARLKRVEADQQKALANQEKILAELDRLRVWVHRR